MAAALAAEAGVRSLGDLLRVLLAFDIFSLLGFVWAESERSKPKYRFYCTGYRGLPADGFGSSTLATVIGGAPEWGTSGLDRLGCPRRGDFRSLSTGLPPKGGLPEFIDWVAPEGGTSGVDRLGFSPTVC